MTKIQLLIFAIVTVVGGAFVGGRYAQVDRLIIDRTFPVNAQFADSGGIFEGAQVTYRGIAVGKVGRLSFNDGGVEVRLDIEKSAPKISDNVLAVVANKSAIGEQFLDLQPRTDKPPYLREGSRIRLADTRIPISTTTLLVDLNSLVNSVDTQSLKTVVNELGLAFQGTGDNLEKILDTSNEFIAAANQNIDITRQLIRGSDSVLQTQLDKSGQLQSFAKNLALLSDTLVEADPDLRRLLDKGTPAAREINEVVSANADDLTSILSSLRIVTRPLAAKPIGIEALAILYPYLLEGGFSVVRPSERDSGEYDAAFGLVLAPTPKTCSYAIEGAASGYRERRLARDQSDIEFDLDLDCRNNEKVARTPSKTEYDVSYPVESKRVPASSAEDMLSSGTSPSPGKESLSWLLLGPAAN